MLRDLVELGHGRVDLAHAAGLLAGSSRNLLHQFRGLADGGHDVVQQLARALGLFHDAAGELADFLRRHLAAFGQLAHFGGHHGKALAVFTGPRGFNRGIQRQQIGLVGDVVDDANLAGYCSSWPPRSP